MFLRQNIWKIIGTIFCCLLFLGVLIPVQAQNNAGTITFTDLLGAEYTFQENPNRTDINWVIERPASQYPDKAREGGIFYNVNLDNFLARQGETMGFVVFVDDLGKLQAYLLGGTYWWAQYRNQGIELDNDLTSLAANQVQILRIHRYGMEVSWLDRQGKAKYAILTVWAGVVEKGDLEDYPGGPPLGEEGEFGPLDPGIIQGTITGKSVVLVLDSSGSMDGEKIEKAKAQIKSRIKKLSADDEVALFIFEGCGDVSLVQPYTQDKSLIIKGLDQATAQGGSSPVAESIRKGMYYLVSYHHGPKGELSIYTDGGENCEGDPVAAASEVKEATLPIDFSIVGYNVSKEEQVELKKIAKAADGKFDKEKVWESGQQRQAAREEQRRLTAFGLTALISAFISYVIHGSFEVNNMFNNVFGAKGLFANLFQGGGSGVSGGGGAAARTAGNAPKVIPHPASPPAVSAKPPKILKKIKPAKPPQKKLPEAPKSRSQGFCAQCGKPRLAGTPFCTHCGAKFI